MKVDEIAVVVLREYAKQEALSFQHFIEFKMTDDDWMNTDDTLKTLGDVWEMYIKPKNDKH